MTYYRKRSRDSLTGGTKDVNPQFMHLTATESAVDTTTTVAFPIPIQRLQNAGRAQVMEILKVFWRIAANNGTVSNTVRAMLSTSSGGTTTLLYSNPRVFDGYERIFVFNVDGSIAFNEQPEIHDLTDGAGHGFLIGTDNIFLQVSSLTTGLAPTVECKILYRWKDVSTVEYVGIVQSQQ